MTRRLKIAIDGPAASGKSTTARLLARRLNYIYIDTGAMYRAATKAVLDAGADPDNESAAVAEIKKITIRLALAGDLQHTYLDDRDVTEEIRTPAIDKAISAISSYPEVRQIMVEKQRELSRNGGVVMDGRDIGTVVLPDADLKVFMVASLETRARRRLADLHSQNANLSLKAVKKEIARRDKIDSSREESPLRKADDARELDTTGLSIGEQVAIIFSWTQQLLDQQ